MAFIKGKRYRDAVGRRWKVVQLVHQRDYDAMVVRMCRRPWIICFAATDTDYPGTATVIFNEFGWTTIYETDD